MRPCTHTAQKLLKTRHTRTHESRRYCKYYHTKETFNFPLIRLAGFLHYFWKNISSKSSLFELLKTQDILYLLLLSVYIYRVYTFYILCILCKRSIFCTHTERVQGDVLCKTFLSPLCCVCVCCSLLYTPFSACLLHPFTKLQYYHHTLCMQTKVHSSPLSAIYYIRDPVLYAAWSQQAVRGRLLLVACVYKLAPDRTLKFIVCLYHLFSFTTLYFHLFNFYLNSKYHLKLKTNFTS